MTLEDLGYNDKFETFRIENQLHAFEIGRIISEHKERYIVKTEKGEFAARISGTMQYASKNREDFPAVGDWVALALQDSGFAIIHRIFPRFSMLSRQAIGQFGARQVIATNIDYALLVQAVDRDFSINRLERYLTICNSAMVNPIIILSKIDLISQDQTAALLALIKTRIKDVPIIALSITSPYGYAPLRAMIKRGKTYCMLGSSGVGKSTLLNTLYSKSIMRTDFISPSSNRGKHVTSHRELFILESGGILIDNPGIRAVGITDAADGLDTTFTMITELSKNCKFNNCTHTDERGCAVLDAVENGTLDRASYENYLKMEREQSHFELTVAEKRKKDKDFGRMVKDFKKDLDRKQ